MNQNHCVKGAKLDELLITDAFRNRIYWTNPTAMTIIFFIFKTKHKNA